MTNHLNITNIKSFIFSEKNLKLRFLIVGGWNTLFSFVVGPLIYYGLQEKMHVLLVGCISYVLTVTMARW